MAKFELLPLQWVERLGVVAVQIEPDGTGGSGVVVITYERGAVVSVGYDVDSSDEQFGAWVASQLGECE